MLAHSSLGPGIPYLMQTISTMSGHGHRLPAGHVLRSKACWADCTHEYSLDKVAAWARIESCGRQLHRRSPHKSPCDSPQPPAFKRAAWNPPGSGISNVIKSSSAHAVSTGRGSQGIVRERIGHYRIIRVLGHGGMGEVYLAEDTKLNRPAAIKTLRPHLVSDETALRRFRQEALAASGLNHPNIVVVYEIGEADGLHYMVTEYVEGETLRATIAAGALRPDAAL